MLPEYVESVRIHGRRCSSTRPGQVEGRSRADLAYILYTSGSTGIPKGVMLTHENALGFVDWCSDVFAPTEADRFSSHAPFHFDLSVLDIYCRLEARGGLCIIVSEDLGKTPKDLARFIADSSSPSGIPHRRFSAFLASTAIWRRAISPRSGFVLFAGEVFPVKHLRSTSPPVAMRQRYYNLYGPTETNVCTYARIPSACPVRTGQRHTRSGGPAHITTSIVLDPDHRSAQVPRPRRGCCTWRGSSVFQGYWNRPELNAQVFLERDGKRWYNTGDVVRLDPVEGYIYVGRRDRMVKRRGYRVELGEIERGLYQHPADSARWQSSACR